MILSVIITSMTMVVQGTVWMSKSFPRSVSDLLPLFQVIAPTNKHLQKLTSFISMKLPDGFPVKLGVHTTHSLYTPHSRLILTLAHTHTYTHHSQSHSQSLILVTVALIVTLTHSHSHSHKRSHSSYTQTLTVWLQTCQCFPQ